MFFLVIKSFSWNAYAGDEWIYLYQSKLVAEGVAPYSGFTMAHPPLQMVVTGLLFKMAGFDFLMARLLPTLWCLAGGLVLAWMVRREYGPLASVTAATLFLTAHEPLRASSHFTGVNMTVAILIAAVAAYRAGALRGAAFLAVCAVFTRLYAIPGILVLTLFALASDWRKGVRLVLWGAGIGLAAALAMGLFCGFEAAYHNLVEYHAHKTPMSAGELQGIKDKVLFHNATIAILFSAALLFLLGTLVVVFDKGRAKRRGRRKDRIGLIAGLRRAVEESRTGLVILSAGIAAAFLVLLGSMDRIWMYYFIPIFPFAGVCAGWMVSRLVRGAVALVRFRGRLRESGVSRGQLAGSALLVGLMVLGFAFSPYLEIPLKYYQDYMKLDPDKRVHTYSFPPSPLPDWVTGLIRATLWRDDRVIGEVYHTFNFLLWHESRVLDIVDDVVTIIEAESSQDAALFGDSTTVPLFALLTGRRVAANEADTNAQRYKSGFVNPDEFVAKIDDPGTELIILRAHFGVAGLAQVRELVTEKYRVIKSMRSFDGRVYHVFKRKDEWKGSPS